jgi:hypothetical protein
MRKSERTEVIVGPAIALKANQYLLHAPIHSGLDELEGTIAR